MSAERLDSDQDFRDRVRLIWNSLAQLEPDSEFGNIEGGSVEQQRDQRLQLHHVANYAAVLCLLSELGEQLDILELGCGSGALSHAFALNMPRGWNLVATDYSDRLVQQAKLRYGLPNLRYDRLDVKNLGADELRGRDAVLLLEVIEHLARTDATDLLERIHQGLRPGARLVMTTLDRSGFPRPFSGYGPHCIEYTFRSMVEFLSRPEKCGFERFQVHRLVSSRIAQEAVRAENRGGYLANRLQRLLLGLAARSALLEALRARTTALLFRCYAALPQSDRFDLEAYLESLRFVRTRPELYDSDSFGLVAVLTKT